MNNIIASRIKNLREQSSLTAEEISSKIGINRSTYSNYENAKRDFPHDVIRNLAREFNVSIDYLYGLTDSKDRITSKDLSAIEDKVYDLAETSVFIKKDILSLNGIDKHYIEHFYRELDIFFTEIKHMLNK